jgi:hypothetical protein
MNLNLSRMRIFGFYGSINGSLFKNLDTFEKLERRLLL